MPDPNEPHKQLPEHSGLFKIRKKLAQMRGWTRDIQVAALVLVALLATRLVNQDLATLPSVLVAGCVFLTLITLRFQQVSREKTEEK